ncbi:MAG: CopD family protein [Bacteroidetes bacterium]|nr:CopD family protein [Bacteroidota bacterium]
MIAYANPYLLALHIIFIVIWFAGLFYIVRLFIYHAEAEKKTLSEKDILQRQYKLMEKRLWYAIAWPGLIGAYIFGTWMVVVNFAFYMASPWFILKLAFILGLVLYHIQCHIMFLQFQKDKIKYSSFKLRLWNEVATLFLVAIAFIVVMKDTLSYVWGIIGLLLFSGTIFLAIRMYKKSREEKVHSGLSERKEKNI